MNAKHTPGPWEDHFCGPFRQTVVDCPNELGLIAVPSERATIEEQDANARLIAAAPEMLEMLRRVSEFLGMTCPESLKEEINDLIVKAQG